MTKRGIVNSILLITLPFYFGSISPKSPNTFQDPLHQKRMAVIRYILETLAEDHSSARNIFNDAFDKESGPYPSDKGYDDWLNLYLSQHMDTLSEEDLKKVSIQDKRILSHEIYFQELKKRLGKIDYDSMHIMPYTDVENLKSLSYCNTVDESEVKDTYVIIYSYLGNEKVEYILFNESDKIRSIAHVTWEPGEPISGVTFL